MNQTIVNLYTAALSNATTEGANNSDGIIQGVYLILDKIVEVLTTSGQFGMWKFLIILFAILGFFAVISAVGNRLLDGFKIIFKFFILLPIIFIVGIWNKKKRKERLKEWGEIKSDFKESSKKIKKRYWIFFALKILFPLFLVAAILWIRLT